MSKTNCINCGAAKELHEAKCPFCGTSYFDFTSIDFSSKQPVALQFMIPTSDPKYKCFITTLAMPKLDTIELTNDEAVCYSKEGAPLFSVTKSKTMAAKVSFESVANEHNELCRTQALRIEE